MEFMMFCRMLVEISFYYSFAGAAAAHFGGGETVLPALLLSVCYILCELLEKHVTAPSAERLQKAGRGESGGAGRFFRYLGLLPAVFWLLLPGMAPADRICFLFPFAYLAAVIWRKDFTLSRYRQTDVFSTFWKAYGIFALTLTIFGGSALLETTVPAALVTAAGSVLLLRALRHGPEVWRHRDYQLRSLFETGFLIAAAWALSRDAVLELLKTVAAAVWNRLLVPVLTVVIVAFSVVFTWLFQLLRYLLTLGHREPQDIGEILQHFTGQGEALTETVVVSDDGSPVWQIVFFVIGILALVILAAVFFRWLLMRAPGEEHAAEQVEKIDHTPPPEDRKAGGIFRNTPAHRIREHYRSYLRCFERQGGTRLPSDTSRELARKTLELAKGTQEGEETLNMHLGRMREIYLRARYRQEVREEDPAEMKRQTSAVKKFLRSRPG